MSKKSEIRHIGVVKEGHKIYYNNDLYKKHILLLEGKEFDEVLKEKRVSVSTDTHGYYRAGVLKTALESEKFGGWDEDELHAFFANMFLKTTFTKVVSGREYHVPKILSTGDLSQAEMNQFIEKVVYWLAQEEIEILSPDHYNLTKYRTIKK